MPCPLPLLGHTPGNRERHIGRHQSQRRTGWRLRALHVGTEQIVDMARNEEVSYQTILNSSRTAGNASTVKTLERIGAPPYQRALDWGAKQKAADEAYKAALKRIPDPKEKYDPWQNAR